MGFRQEQHQQPPRDWSKHTIDRGLDMFRNKGDEYKGSEEAGTEPLGNLALVIRIPIAQMPEAVHLVQQLSGARIVYQRASVGRLHIVAED